VTHYLPNVTDVFLYGTDGALDQVVFHLATGRDYVINSDLLVDYVLPADGSVTIQEVPNQLYHHYDPYLQGEKQEWHRQWADEQFMERLDRLPTDDEWLAILNELTRGVEHHQMQRWIEYSPPVIDHFVRACYVEFLGREPRPAELAHYRERLLAGESYADVEIEIAGKGVSKR